MKRDMDLIRAILLKIEEQGSPTLAKPPTIEGADAPSVAEHLRLLYEAGLIDAAEHRRLAGAPLYLDMRLTWEGHEFLENVRDPQVWSNTKAAAQKVGGFSFGLIAELAAGYLKAKAAALGLPMM